jgi:outer membrane protein TolC
MKVRHKHIGLKNVLLSAAFLTFTAAGTGAQQTLTVDKAVEIAMKNSPTMIRSRISLERSQEQLNIQEAALKPNLTLRLNPFSRNSDRRFDSRFADWYSSWTQSTSSTFTVSQTIRQTDATLSLNNQLNWQDSYSEAASPGLRENRMFNNSLTLNLSQPIFTYNRTKLALRELELDLENTQIQYSLQTLSLERQVTQNFYSVYQSKTSLDIARDELKNQEQSYEIIKGKVDAGLSAKEELYQAELNLANARASVENSQVSLENALDSFKQLIGMPITDEIVIEADIAYKPIEIVLERATDHALKLRMELRQRNIDIETAKNNILTASAQNEFKGSVTLSLGLTGTNQTLMDVYQSPTNKQTIGLSFDIPLWDWGEKKSRINSARLGLKSSELSLEDEKIGIILAVRQAYRNLNNLVNQIDIAEQSLRNAQLTYEINLERYKNGDLTSMDLSLYQNQLTQRKTSLTNAQINYKLAILNMKVLTLWDYEKNQAVTFE